jgi:hypothetical protein
MTLNKTGDYRLEIDGTDTAVGSATIEVDSVP